MPTDESDNSKSADQLQFSDPLADILPSCESRELRIRERLGLTQGDSPTAAGLIGIWGSATEIDAEARAGSLKGIEKSSVKAIGKAAGIIGTVGEATWSTLHEVKQENSAALDVIIAGKISRIGSAGIIGAGASILAVETGPAAPAIGFAAGSTFDGLYGEDIETGTRSLYVALTDRLMHPLDCLGGMKEESNDSPRDDSENTHDAMNVSP